MDSIISAVIDEVCSQTSNGIALTHLWPRIQKNLSSAGLHLCNGVKQAIWNRILTTPGLNFQAGGSSLGSVDPSIQSVEESERLGLKIVAADHLRDSFLGLYDLKEANSDLSALHRQALDRLAAARTNGITQSQLAKELGVEGNKIFYIVRSLESRQLIMRQSTIIRTKETGIEGENEMKNNSVVKTNLIHLYRFAKHLRLSSQQRVEITRSDAQNTCPDAEGNELTAENISEECSKKDVLIKDYLPAMKAVCEKLEEASDKVLVVSDIKQALGYRKNPGHRAWRNICHRLKDACLVEEFHAEVNKKVVTCLRLLKKFDPQNFQPKISTRSHDDSGIDQLVKCGKRGQITDELVELPIEHQLYDMIDAAGSKGIIVDEVRKRLGISHKRHYNRLGLMFQRFGFQLQPESHKKLAIYRVWTFENFNPSSTVFPSNSEVPDEHDISTQSTRDLLLHQQSSFPEDEFTSPDKCNVRTVQVRSESQSGCPENEQLVIWSADQLNSGNEVACTAHDLKLDSVSAPAESDAVPPKASSGSPVPQRYPCLAETAVSIQREQRILEKLQDEKFTITAELYRWLENFEKEKPTAMARKTLTRVLKKLQQKGQCRCVSVSVPVLTNCGRSRTTEVVLHPSIESLTPEILGQIYERFRLFDMQIRGQGLSRSKNGQPVPVLTGVKKTLSRVDKQAVTAEAMRVNGFVPAKMVRVKLLHNFLWSYMSSLSDWHDSLTSGKTCKSFVLEAALKAMPLELFLQVVGSAQKSGNMVESCRRGLCLSDLPIHEYKCLMSTCATGRLSRMVDILCRLKLIRLVTDGHVGVMDSCAVLVYAMELKPYIEEPLSRALPSSSVNSSDLRPRIRHDFILSTMEVVDNYWKTLEYCYAAADPVAALQAFPGSAVHELCLNRSWTSIRVMTTEQRIELLERVSNDDPDKKIALKDCIKIAKDLNLSVEQVLRVSYDKRRSFIRRSTRDSKPTEQEDDGRSRTHGSISRKRKISLEERSIKRVKNDTEASELSIQRPQILAIGDVSNVDEEKDMPTSLEDREIHLRASDEEIHVNAVQDNGANEEDDRNCSSNTLHYFLRPRPTRQKKYIWTEKSERQLVIQYARYRAALGPRYNRVDWSSISDLPAPPDTCRRRMGALNRNLNVRKAVMRLCNQLGDRYAKHLQKVRQKELVNYTGPSSVSSFEEHYWDDFEDQNISVLVDEVLQCNRMMNRETYSSKRLGSRLEKEWSDYPQLDDTNLDTRASELERFHKHCGAPFSAGRRRSSRQCLPQKFIKLLNDKDISFSRRACESMAIANAVELLKVAFLSTSAAPSLLAATLRRYSEHDLFAAFSYLKEKKFMVVGQGSRPFVFSQKFWHSASSSPFPVNTGKRAANFANWLHQREKDLMEDGINLRADVQCGDVFHLSALVSLGELSISPCLPDEGIGEADEQDLNCKEDEGKSYSGRMVKKQKPLCTEDSEFSARREKGFPGIIVSISRSSYSRARAMELFMDEENHCITSLHDKTYQPNSSSDLVYADTQSVPNRLNPCHELGSSISVAVSSNESRWEAINSYAKLSLSAIVGCRQDVTFSPQLFETVHNAIHKAGDQGLNMEEISQTAFMQGEEMAEAIVDVLQVCGLVVKANAYDCARVVDASYGRKYFLYPISGHSQGVVPASCDKSQLISNDSSLSLPRKTQENASTLQDTTFNISDGHKVTIIDLPEETAKLHPDAHCGQGEILFENQMQVDGVSFEGGKSESCITADNMPAFWPILPWMNADGTTNTIIYKGLTRRVLGIVMQNPGIMEVDIVLRMGVLNPQSCRKLLELLVLDNHLIVREMHQKTSGNPPSILGSLLQNGVRSSVSTFCKHYFANPMSTYLL